MKRFLSKLVPFLTAASILMCVSAQAADLTAKSCKAYVNKNELKMFNKKITRFEMELENNSDDEADVSMLLVKFSGNVCKGVMIADAVHIEANKTAVVAVPTQESELTGIDMVKCIAVEKDNNGIYPVLSAVYELGKKWTTVQTVQ